MSLEQLAKEYRNFIYKIINRYFPRDSAQQEDAMQTVLIALNRHISELDPNKSIRGFIATTTINACISLLREKQKEKASSGHGDTFDSILKDKRRNNLEQSPISRALNREQLRIFKAAIGQLPKAEQEALALAQAKVPYQKIADMLGIPIGTVRSRIFSAKKRLSKLLGKDFLEE
jgi:RNA polymerase sigma-70 factor (ECF subfamily)